MLRHAARGIGRQPLQARRGIGFTHDEHAALGGSVTAYRIDDPRHRGPLLSDGGVHADDVAPSLIDDRVHGDRRFPRSAVADDELTLPAAQRDGSVHDEQAGCERAIDQRAIYDGRSGPFDGRGHLRRDRLAAIERPSEGIDYPAEKHLAHGHSDHIAGAAHQAPGSDGGGITEQNTADARLIEVDRLRHDTTLELEQLIETGVRQPFDPRHPVAGLDHAADPLELRRQRRATDPLPAPGRPLLEFFSEPVHVAGPPRAAPRWRLVR